MAEEGTAVLEAPGTDSGVEAPSELDTSVLTETDDTTDAETGATVSDAATDTDAEPGEPEAPQGPRSIDDLSDDELEANERFKAAVDRRMEMERKTQQRKTTREFEQAARERVESGRFYQNLNAVMRRATEDGRDLTAQELQAVGQDLFVTMQQANLRSVGEELRAALPDGYRVPAEKLRELDDIVADIATRQATPKDLFRAQVDLIVEARLEAEWPKREAALRKELRKSAADEKQVAAAQERDATRKGQMRPTGGTGGVATGPLSMAAVERMTPEQVAKLWDNPETARQLYELAKG